jgi:hypothetical protein
MIIEEITLKLEVNDTLIIDTVEYIIIAVSNDHILLVNPELESEMLIEVGNSEQIV